MLAILLFLIILLISFGAGARLLRLAGLFPPVRTPKSNPSPSAEEFVFATSLGLGLLAYLVLALGVCRLLYIWAFALLLLLLAVLVRGDLLRLLKGIGGGLQRGFKTRLPYFSGGLGVWCAAMLGLALVGALAPAGGTDWDGLAYHLAVPRIYLQHHRILLLPWVSHSNFPFTMEMLYLLGLALRGQALAKLFHLGFGALIGLAVYCWGRGSFGKGAGPLAAAIFASVPLVLWEATVAYNELAFALFCLLSIWAWWKRTEGSPSGWILLSGVFAGLALGTKTLAGFLVVFMLLAILWRKSADESPASAPQPGRLKSLALWLVPALVIAAPWYLKSYLWTGNPVYPFFYGLFDGRFWSEDLAVEYGRLQGQFGLGHGPGWLFALPWTLTMYGRCFYDQPKPHFFNLFITVLGPLFLAFLPLMVWQSRRDSLLRFLLSYCGVAAVVWFLLTQQSRYLMPIFPVLSLGAAGAIVGLLQRLRWLWRLSIGVVILELLLGTATCLILIGPQIPVVVGLESQNEYLSRTLDIYPISRRVNSSLPKNARVMLLGETRGFYLDREYLWGMGHNNLISPAQTASPQLLAAALQRLGVTHLLVSEAARLAISSERDALNKSLQGLISEGKLRQVLGDSRRGFAVFEVGPG